MMLNFKEDAIILSGTTGTKLKSKILGKYYKKWWEITSGGDQKKHQLSTAIIEMNAATGEIYIKDSDETLFGSSGHALNLLANNPNRNNLKIILVEKNNDCFMHLQKVINKKWPKLSYTKSSSNNKSDIFLIQNDSCVNDILTKHRLGNSLFFFDPLLSVSWQKIETIAQKRIKNYYDSGTEFLIFLFTTDFFFGRNEYAKLPNINDESAWSENQLKTVKKLDELFGDTSWRDHLLNSQSNNDKINLLVKLYKEKLQKWFRYVLPLPFFPKKSQIYHIFFCSNFELGVTLTKDFYAEFTKTLKFRPNNTQAYKKFLELHPEKRTSKPKRSSEWKILWKIITSHEDGLCDKKCNDLKKIVFSENIIDDKLKWLKSKGYLVAIKQITRAWKDMPQLYKLDWNFIEKTLIISSPTELNPSSMNTKIPKLDHFFII